ncbi:MAG: hypothetical protein VW802_04345 [Rhodospirillaceae bacterium]|jgi:hypothetical protein
MKEMITPENIIFNRRQLLCGTVLVAANCLVPSSSLAKLSRLHQQIFRNITKSLWIWQTPLDQLPKVLDYAQRWNFKTLNYSIIPQEHSRLLGFNSSTVKMINKARRQGNFKFIALSGAPNWAYHGEQTPETIINLLKIHRDIGGLFDGIHLNIEPHKLKGWRGAKRRQLAEGYYQLVKIIAEQTKELKIPLNSTMYPAYARVAVPSLGSSILKSVIPYLNSVSISAYRNNPRHSFRIASLTLRQLASAETHWWMGVATHKTRNEKKTSYKNQSAAYFIESLSKLDTMARATRARKNYAGITIQHYGSVMRLTG